MLMGDLLSLTQLRLPVKVVVCNNGALGFIEPSRNPLASSLLGQNSKIRIFLQRLRLSA
jgi:thiamine pyrophosphate-dependent acetolactate synthase large subunit-like protein